MAQRAAAAAFEDAISHEFETDTGTIYYEVLGHDSEDRPWVTLIHNFMSTGRTAWAQIAPKLAESYRVLVPDLPGHGRSVGYPQGFHYGTMAQQLAGLMQAVGVFESPDSGAGHLAGCSAGGMIAQLLVAQGLVNPQTLTLISTTHSMNPETAGAPVTSDPDRFRFGGNWIEATAGLHDPHQGEGYFRRELLQAATQRTPRLTVDLSLSALAEWSMPVCLIHGEDDEFFPIDVARNMAAHLPAAQLHVIPGQSHALIFRQGWKVRDLMFDFLSAHSNSGR